jgi:hypothetical protein
MSDGYARLIDNLRAGLAETRSRIATEPVRESAGLLDLPGVPMVDGYQPPAVEAVREDQPTAGDFLDALGAAGVPMRPSFAERITSGRGAWGAMRLSDSARDTVLALAAKADEAARARVPASVATDESSSGEPLELPGVPMVEDAKPRSGEELLAESKREQAAEDGVREAGLPTYGGPEFGTPEVEYDDGTAYQLVSELYALLAPEIDNGTENLENSKVEDLARSILGGKPLTAVQYGVLKELAAKYAKELAAARADGDASQDYMQVPNPATGRLVTTPGHSNTAEAASGRLAA